MVSQQLTGHQTRTSDSVSLNLLGPLAKGRLASLFFCLRGVSHQLVSQQLAGHQTRTSDSVSLNLLGPLAKGGCTASFYTASSLKHELDSQWHCPFFEAVHGNSSHAAWNSQVPGPPHRNSPSLPLRLSQKTRLPSRRRAFEDGLRLLHHFDGQGPVPRGGVVGFLLLGSDLLSIAGFRHGKRETLEKLWKPCKNQQKALNTSGNPKLRANPEEKHSANHSCSQCSRSSMHLYLPERKRDQAAANRRCGLMLHRK